jgi:hypothetical protein
MGNVLTIMRWEWFKLLRRRMTWILLAILFGFTQLTVLGAYTSYRSVAATGGIIINNPGRTTGTGPRVLRCRDLKGDAAVALPGMPQGVPAQVLAGLQAQCEQQIVTRYNALRPAGSVLAVLGVASGM